MTFHTVSKTDFDAYLDDLYPAVSQGAADGRAAEEQERQLRLAAFPHSAMLQLTYPELDYANRWCWQQFGPAHGECYQASSEYPACKQQGSHSHDGEWVTHWLAKTSYDFGYNEWCFSKRADLELFLEFVPLINGGEGYSE